jgi:hypothetical protein
MTKTYLVQCWDDAGAKKNHYEVSIASAAELRHLKKFLRQTCAHVVIAPVQKKPAKPAKK